MAVSGDELVVSFTGETGGLDKATNRAAASLGKFQKNTVGVNQSLMNFNRVVQDAPFGILGIANNIDPLITSFQNLKKETGGTGAALKAMAAGLTGPAGIALGISAVTSFLITFGSKLFDTDDTAKKTNKTLGETKETLESIAAGFAATSVTKIESFRLALTNLQAPMKDRSAILDDYNKIVDKQNQLSETDLNNIGKINGAINNQIKLYQQRALVRGAEDQISELYKTVFANEFKLQKMAAKQTPLGQLTDEEKSRIPRMASATDRLTAAQKASLPTMRNYVKLSDMLQKFDTGDIDRANLAAIQNLPYGDERGALTNIRNAKKEISALFDFIRAQQAKGGIAVMDLDQDTPDVKKAAKESADEFAWDWFKELQRNPKLITPPENAPVSYADSFLKGMQAELNKGAGVAIPINFTYENTKMLEEQAAQLRQQAAFNAQLQETANIVNGVVTPAFGNMYDAIVAGEDPLRAFFSSLMQSINQLIRQLIQAAIQAAVISAISQGGSNPVSFAAAFGKIAGFASGGIVPQGFPNDSFPAMLSSNEAVIPLNQLHNYLPTASGGGDHYELRLRNRDFRLQQSRSDRSKRRTG